MSESDKFYGRKIYKDLHIGAIDEATENKIDIENLNRIFCKSSEYMSEIPDRSIHLVVTSPPYNVGKEYEGDLSLKEYREFLVRVWSEIRRVLVIGGRVCINIANLGRKPYIPLHAFIIQDMLDLGFIMRGEIIWNKGASVGASTAWGSWMSATNPALRDMHEYILIFSYGQLARKSGDKKSTISKEEFLEFTKSIWTFKTESARRIGHPAPFPLELPYRLIQLYSFEGDIVLDPFMGSGQVAIAAIKTKRYFIGYEIKKEYVDLAMQRINQFLNYSPNLFDSKS